MKINRGTSLAIIAIIIAATGFVLVMYDMIFIQPPGQASASQKTYYCSSSAELQGVIDDIGSGNGLIIVTDDITVSETINIDGGGVYVIQGDGSFTIEVLGDYCALNITSASYCKIEELIFDGTAITSITSVPIIHINEANDNPVFIHRNQFVGDSISDCRGILFNSDNVAIEGCEFLNLREGAFSSGADHSYFAYNSLYNTYTASYFVGTFSSKIEGNIVRDTTRGIMLGTNSYGVSIVNNYIENIRFTGMFLNYVDLVWVSGNTICFDLGTGDPIRGIYNVGVDNSTFSGNLIYGIDNGVSGIGFVLTDNCDYDRIIGNILLSNFDNNIDVGTGPGHVLINNQEGP